MFRLISNYFLCVIHLMHTSDFGSSLNSKFYLRAATYLVSLLPFTMILLIMNCFCRMVDQQNSLSFISNRDHRQRFSSSQTSDMPWAEFEPAWNPSSDFVQKTCAVVIITRQLNVLQSFYCSRNHGHITARFQWE